MGFLDNLKNSITGGAAVVQVDVGSVQRGVASSVRIVATARADLKVAAVYLLVRATEKAQVRETDHFDGNQQRIGLVNARRVSFEKRVPVAGPTDLREGQSCSWDAQLELPTQVGPSLKGQMIEHLWEIQAALDVAGNDPDSGWQPLTVS